MTPSHCQPDLWGDNRASDFSRPPSIFASSSSVYSTSTMTRTDNPGPGRLLDKFVYQRAGRAIERTLARVAHRAGYGPVAAAQRILSAFRDERFCRKTLFHLVAGVDIGTMDTEFYQYYTDFRIFGRELERVDAVQSDCKKLASFVW